MKIVWTLRSKTFADRYWTVKGDYTPDVTTAIHFSTEADARRWLAVHRYLRGLEVVYYEETP